MASCNRNWPEFVVQDKQRENVESSWKALAQPGDCSSMLAFSVVLLDLAPSRALGKITVLTKPIIHFLPRACRMVPACAAEWSALCLLKPCNSISGHPTHSGRGAEMCHPLIVAFQVLVKICASVGKRIPLWISGTHLQQLAHQGYE